MKGARVYKKGNYYYHRDTFHKGYGAHLEVYNKRGKHIGEADIYTGELIPNTEDKEKHLDLQMIQKQMLDLMKMESIGKVSKSFTIRFNQYRNF